jgi:DNA-directed RNA polymerase specialized sigma24 family protein
MTPHEPSQTYAENARHQAMHSAMAALRDPLMLVAIDGVAYEETAVRLGLPMGTLKSRINRARRQLRTTLAEHF